MTLKITHPSAILDTSVLIVLYHLNLLQYLIFFYNKVRIPREVEKEFLTKNKDAKECSKRLDFLLRFYQQNGSWFVPCNEYGSDIVEVYLTEKNIDKGEAEAFAQNQALGNNHEILLDEKEGRKLAQNKNVHFHGVLFILANLEIKFQVCDYFNSVEQVRNEMGTHFSKNIINQVYTAVKENV